MISSLTRARSWYAKCGVAGQISASTSSMVGSRTGIGANLNRRLAAARELFLQRVELGFLTVDERGALAPARVGAEVGLALREHVLAEPVDRRLELLPDAGRAVDGLRRAAGRRSGLRHRRGSRERDDRAEREQQDGRERCESDADRGHGKECRLSAGR